MPPQPRALRRLNGRPFSSSHPSSRSGLHRHGVPAPTHPPCPMGLSVRDSQSQPLPVHITQRLVRAASRVAELAGGFFLSMATVITRAAKKSPAEREAPTLRGLLN